MKHRRWQPFFLAGSLSVALLLSACSTLARYVGASPDRICVVLDTGQENDKGFNEYTLRGARAAAQELDVQFAHVSSRSEKDYAPNINGFIAEGCDLIMTVGFLMGAATAEAARANPDIHFAIVDVAYYPGAGCDEGVDSCYTAEGGLANVTSLMFAEDEVGYLAGTLAGCLTESGVIGSVAGMRIPPVEKFVVGYQTGAERIRPDVQALNEYIPSFDDPTAGLLLGEEQLRQGADVIFGVGGNTGNGGLVAAHDAGVYAIGVDVDQYYTLPAVSGSLVTSAMKNMDVAAADAVRAFVLGELEPGVELSTVANGGIGLAPFHDFETAIPESCKEALSAAEAGLADGSIKTGYGP